MDLFVLKWLSSIVIGVLWVAAFTTVAEKISGKLGGLLVGLPSTAVISLLFIGLTQDTNAVTTAAVMVPFSSGLYCFFFITYLLVSKKGFWKGLLVSLLVWFLFAYLSSIIAPANIYVSSFIWVILEIITIFWVVKNIHIKKEEIQKDIVSSPLWVKALLGGIVISMIVLIGKLAGARWGGIFATFPALTVTTFLITIRSGGVEFTRLVAKNVMISTTTTIAIYAILCYFLFSPFGIIVGSILSYVGLLMISIPFYYLVLDKLQD